MTLLEVIEPICQYTCRLNRSARKGGHFEHFQVCAEMESLFTDVLSKAASDPVLAGQMDKDKGKIELVLAFFIDFMIRDSKLSFANEWQDLAEHKYNELSGDEKFWDLLEETLAERGDAANERLAVFYTMIGLGYTGWYTGQPEYLQKKMIECAARLRYMMDIDEKTILIPDSELYQNTSDLIEPPGKSLMGIAIASGILIAVLLLGNIYLYHRNTVVLQSSLSGIIGAQARYVGDQSSPGETDGLR